MHSEATQPLDPLAFIKFHPELSLSSHSNMPLILERSPRMLSSKMQSVIKMRRPQFTQPSVLTRMSFQFWMNWWMNIGPISIICSWEIAIIFRLTSSGGYMLVKKKSQHLLIGQQILGGCSIVLCQRSILLIHHPGRRRKQPDSLNFGKMKRRPIKQNQNGKAKEHLLNNYQRAKQKWAWKDLVPLSLLVMALNHQTYSVNFFRLNVPPLNQVRIWQIPDSIRIIKVTILAPARILMKMNRKKLKWI